MLLVNARHVKNVPGRKDDWIDCQWLQKLHTFGLLSGSFRPDAEIAALRSYVRHRDTLVVQASSWVHRMQKALVQMNVQLHTVLTDITGVTGMSILREIVAGERNPSRLARHRDYRCRASKEQIVAALTGHYRDEHLFALRQALESYDFYQRQLRECDSQIEQRLAEIARRQDVAAELPAARRKHSQRDNEPRFELRAPLFALTAGVDITQLPGISPYNGLKLLSEVGTDMTRFKTDKHFVSWLTLSPHVNASGGRVLSSHTRPSASRAAHIFRLAARKPRPFRHRAGRLLPPPGRTHRKAQGHYRPQLASSPSSSTACCADKLDPKALDANYYDEQQRDRTVRSLRRRAKSLGLQLLDASTGEVVA